MKKLQKKQKYKKGMGWGVWESVLENKGTGEGAEMFIIGFVGAVVTERKKKKINEEKLDFKIKYTYPHLFSVFIHIFRTIYG
jgi:hypothetical protein